ncbi:RHS repeat-associated core domain-containing protein [Amycolatopsis sp. NPDC101161]|uniref:RHS repeat-associated core domain-containing protein n=1 Tax=Amycolatopsis sp. NPDC101161 TaxID=3363940 RepID=UPI0038170093
MTDPAGHKTLDTYQNSLLTSETRGYGTADAGTSSYTYDPVTLGVSTQTDADGNLQTFTYDDHGNKTSESNALGFTTDYVYDDSGNLLETIDPNGVATVNQYDQAGQIPPAAAGIHDLTSTTKTRSNNVVESTTGNFGPAPVRTAKFFYDDAAHPGDRTRITDPNGKTTTTAFDAFGDKVSESDGAGDKTQSGYDTATGLLTSIVDGNGTAAGVVAGCTPPAKGCTTYGHDAYGNVTLTTDPLGHKTSAVYDADGNKKSVTDANSHTTASTFDPADQLVKATLADNTTQITDYNPDGTVAGTIDGLNAKTTYGYDRQGRKNSRTDPDNRTTSSHLDPVGRVLTTTDPAGRVTTIGYDAAGQSKTVSYSDGVTPNVGYGYDPAGHRLSMTDGTGTSTWTYNTFGEVMSQTQGSGASVGYGYDDNGNQTSITYPGQTTSVVRTFDDAERLKTVTDWGTNKTTFGYDNDGGVKTAAYPNGTTVTNGYNDAVQLTSTTAVTGTATVFSMTFGRDPIGQLSSRQIGTASQTFDYNAKNQLKADGATTYGVDAADNPTTVGTSTQVFDAAGQLCWTLPSGTVANPSCDTVPTGATSSTSDGLGERKTTGSNTYGYDQAGRLTTLSGPASASYRYNGDGLRTAKTVGGTTTTFVWTAEKTPNLLTDGTNSYLYGPGGLPIEQIGAAGSSWFVHDQVGSTVCLLNATGGVAGSYTYTPYGVATHTGTAVTPLQFTGQFNDTESGLVYLRARYYDAVTALFLTVDPKVGETRTPYAYTSDDPLNLTDIAGLSWWNPFSWSKDTWSTIGAYAGYAGLAVGAIGIGLATFGVGDVLIGGAVTVGVVADVTATTLGAVSTAVTCAQNLISIGCGVGILSTGLGAFGTWAGWGFAPGSWGMYANVNSLTSGIAGTVWGLNESGGGGGGGTAAPAPRTYSPYGGAAIVC